MIAGPDPKVHRVIRWRCIDLCAEVTRRLTATVPERTSKLGLTRLQPRPYHPKKDAATQEAFKQALLGVSAATPVEIWFQDEARVGQKGWFCRKVRSLA